MSPEGELLDASRDIFARHRPVEEADDTVCADPRCRQPWPCEPLRRAREARAARQQEVRTKPEGPETERECMHCQRPIAYNHERGRWEHSTLAGLLDNHDGTPEGR